MNNIPAYITSYGVASLILDGIPARKEAYVRIQSSLEPERLLEECISFCTVCGAERVFATGSDVLEKYSLHASVLQMNGDRAAIGDTDACLIPVQEQTARQWREIYNEAMQQVDHAAWMSASAMKSLVLAGDAYFVHRGGQLLGIGKAAEDRIDAVAAVVRGAGADVVRALTHALTGDSVVIEVASTNHRAIKLYERLGFIVTRECTRWYQIF